MDKNVVCEFGLKSRIHSTSSTHETNMCFNRINEVCISKVIGESDGHHVAFALSFGLDQWSGNGKLPQTG